jgi:hypothetical protein
MTASKLRLLLGACAGLAAVDLVALLATRGRAETATARIGDRLAK